MGRYYNGFPGNIHKGHFYRGGGKGNQYRKVLKITKLHFQIHRVDYSICDSSGVSYGKKGVCDYANFQLWAREEITRPGLEPYK